MRGRSTAAPSTVSRLLNMGVEPFLVTASTRLILAQRLCRVICTECKKPVDVPAQALTDMGVRPEEIGTFQVFEPGGCRVCNERGYKGRIYHNHGTVNREFIKVGAKNVEGAIAPTGPLIVPEELPASSSSATSGSSRTTLFRYTLAYTCDEKNSSEPPAEMQKNSSAMPFNV